MMFSRSLRIPCHVNRFILIQLGLFLFGVISAAGQLTSFRVENFETIKSLSVDGELTLYAEQRIDIRIFSSQRISSQSQISFTNIVSDFGNNCNDLRKTDIYELHSLDDKTAILTVSFSKSDALLDGYLMFCFRDWITINGTGPLNWTHQGYDKWMRISLFLTDNNTEVIMIWVKSLLVPIFLLLSALFSGLSLNVLSLTKSELKVLRNQGTPEEKQYSKAVLPLRKRGNILFCSLLLMNILANVVVAVLLYELIQLYSILAATLLIVFLGEIVPQTICSKYGLSFGNKMGWLTNVFFVLSLPFSYPVGKLMDIILDDEVPAVYNRDRFQEMLTRSEKSTNVNTTVTNQASNTNEVKAFKLSNRTVGDIMVKLEEAYMEDYNSILTVEKVSEILKRGYTRIPVYEKERSNVVALLHIRDLTLIDPKDQLTLKTVCKFYNRPVNFVFEDTKLTIMLEEFKKGQSHMALVQRVNDEGPGDPFYETLGMITLEDVIEDIFHSDSVVATRQLVHNVFDPQIHFQNSKISSDLERLKFNKYLGLHKTMKSERDLRDEDSQLDNLPHNLIEAIKHFLPTVPAFQPDLISPSVLERLLKLSHVIKIKVANHNTSSSSDGQEGLSTNKDSPIVDKGKPMDFFILVLEGRVQITIGAEDFLFIEGPFCHFGHQALLNAVTDNRTQHLASDQNQQNVDGSGQPGYVPDFTVLPMSETVYLKVSQSVYLSSLQATQLQRLNQRMDSASDISITSRPDQAALQVTENDMFVEVNNARNSHLNLQKPLSFPGNMGFPSSQDYFINPKLDHMATSNKPSPKTTSIPYELQGDPALWYSYPSQDSLPSLGDATYPEPRRKGDLIKSPSNDWMNRHIKTETTHTSSTVPEDDSVDKDHL